jgi:DNA-binding CsgD family transcriptional regulator
MFTPASSALHAPSVPGTAPSARVSPNPSSPIPAHAAVAAPELADLIDDPWLALSVDGALLGANRAARLLLQAGDTLMLERGRVVPADLRLRVSWRAALGEARAGRRRLLWSREADARSLLLQPGLANAPVLLRVGDDSTGRLRRLWAYAQANALSAQETRVLEALADGESPAGVARRHQVGISTVRTQIRGIVTKTRVGGMRELLAHMARVVA